MKRKNIIKRIISIACTVVLCFCVCGSTVMAASTDSFTHADDPGGASSTILAREIFAVNKQINSDTLGLEGRFEGLNDVYCGKDGKVYLLCSDNSNIVILNEDYSYDKTIVITDESNVTVDFKGAMGIYVNDANDKIYICDTENGRILISDNTGKLIMTLERPESSLLQDNFIYQPSKLLIDEDGYIYILSTGCYYGLLLYSSEYEFKGFYGSNSVDATALDTLEYLWDMLTSNETKEASSQKILPYSFVDLCIDANGYIITCTGKTDASVSNDGQLYKIAPDGSNILYKRAQDGKSTSASDINFVESKITVRYNRSRIQDLISLDVDPYGNIYTLDQTYGIIYVYDRECNLLGGFGGGSGIGNQIGVFKKATSIAVHGTNVLVTDSEKRSLTVFKITDFGSLLMEAQDLQIKGDYTEAAPLWTEVLTLDRGNQLAYSGLAMSEYLNSNYSLALEYAKNGMDYSTYDMAKQEQFKQFAINNFVWILVISIIVICGLVAFAIIVNKKQIIIIKNNDVRSLTSVTLHPFRAFSEIKYNTKMPLIIAFIILLMFYISGVLEETASGFLFTDTAAKDYNTLNTLAKTIGLILLWTVMNWLIASLFSGKGRLRDVFIATTYSSMPMVVFTFIRVILSHFLPLSGMAFLKGVSAILMLYTFFLLSVAIMHIHDYNFPKFILTGIVTVFGMILAVFLLFMILILLQQTWEFIEAIYTEVVYR